MQLLKRVDQLSPREQQRGLWTVMTITFLMNAGFFLIIPLVSVHYVDELGWAAAYIGLVLAVRQFAQQGLTVFGGALADRFGPKNLILLGVVIRAVSFVIMGYAIVPWMLMLSGFLAAVGGALFDAPQRASLAALAPPERQTELYGRLGILQNVARSVGPLIGAFLIAFDFEVVGLGAAGFFLVAGLVALVFFPPISVSVGPQTVQAGLKLALRDRVFVVFTALMMGFWFMWVQLSIAMPLYVKNLTGDNSSVGVFLTVAAVLAVVLQLPAIRLSQRYLRPLTTIIAGVVSMALGLGLVALTNSMPQFYVALLFFALGSVLATPPTQTVTAEMCDDRARGAYFGVSSLALAVGGGLGHILGGSLVDQASRLNLPALPWVVFAVVGLATAAGLLAFDWWRGDRLSRRLAHSHASGD
jgi:DHA1 family multidrug resistance protein-like MFS transporter